MTTSTKKSPAKKLGRPSQVGPYVELMKSTPKGETVSVGNLQTQAPFASSQAADYRKKTILAAVKSAKVAVVKVADGQYNLVLTGRKAAKA